MVTNAEPGHYTIAAAATASGLSIYVIRMWERRYGAVVPPRTPGRSRLYSQADVDRLIRLRKLTEAGHAIRHIATLPDAELDKLIGALPSSDALVPKFLDALQEFDIDTAEAVVMRAAALLGPRPFIRDLVVPILHAIGERWRSGELRVYHEHTASTLLRSALMGLLRTQSVRLPDHVAVIGTLTGEHHQLGALMAAVIVADHGWRVIVLDHEAPAQELRAAAIDADATALLVSFVNEHSAVTQQAMDELVTSLPPSITLLAGGRTAGSYVGNGRRVKQLSLDELDDTLDSLERA